MNKHILSLGFAGILCLGFAGCEKGDGVTAVSQGDLVGRWNFTSIHAKYHSTITVNGKTNSYDQDTTQSLAGKGNFAQFNQDLTCSADIPLLALGLGKRSAAAAVVTGTWSVSGNTITLISTDKQDTVALAAAVSGTSGTFTIANESSFDEGADGTYKTTSTSEIKATKVAALETKK
jgi:hypothetical protein